MEHIFGRLGRQLKLENCYVILFLDNAPSHQETLQDPLEFIKLVFLPKNKTPKLQPADAGIICNRKAKYRKHLVRHVASLLNGENTASTIIKQVILLDVLLDAQSLLDEVNESAIRNCFKKCGFSQVKSVTKEVQDDAEFQD